MVSELSSTKAKFATSKDRNAHGNFNIHKAGSLVVKTVRIAHNAF